MSIEELEAWHAEFEREHPEWTIGESRYPSQEEERERRFQDEMAELERRKAQDARRELSRYLNSSDPEAVQLVSHARSVLTKRTGSAEEAEEMVQSWIHRASMDKFEALAKQDK